MKKEEQDLKVYYSIGEVAGMFGVNASLIRFWEKEFDIIKPHKNKKGNRQFTKNDVDNFHLIYHLVKEKGMTLKGAQLQLKDRKEETELRFEIIKKLKNIKEELISIKDNLK
ncbi:MULTISPECIES: MerR family transcriptional regulator [Porphyromonadaceae]|uniref:MerR family transcriptional regulator n=1 Tax=Sanguibacteroides justesenii TaxID=1547597 RepID=A0A0C3M8Z7_9PORP|nr:MULTISPECIES: MerR family transcriptional regulator [Porphyromonadaceae]KIO42893.1 MerR family transcriptional regulator [Sanguibacteroides justesenii]KIO46146.1 MerR family transcriptional regulator [Sanguibacteroides justesenii]MCR9010876.1 MerR family transcriptional regulator [Gabonibacter chumensis]PXZ44212.1 MerR family transcriptional regulator [Sanguibacteroides justesenii]